MIQPTDNPLLQPWQTPHGLPPFNKIRPEHFAPAFAHAMRSHRAEVDAIAANTQPPTFDNTLAALDRCGRELVRIEQLFFNLTASETSPVFRRLNADVAGCRACSAIHRMPESARIDAVSRRRGDSTDAGQSRLVERVHLDFVRAACLARGQRAMRRSRSTGRAQHFSQESWPTKSATTWFCGTSAISRACRRTCALPRARRRRNAASTTLG
jgi:peptidyl-dipeptidase Dcp